MSRYLYIFLIFVMPLSAMYNPFFDVQSEKSMQTSPRIMQKNIPKKKSYKLLYFGYIETNKGKFALISVEDQSFVVKQGDKIYVDGDEINIYSLNSNSLVVKDGFNRVQSIYFSKIEEDPGTTGGNNAKL